MLGFKNVVVWFVVGFFRFELGWYVGRFWEAGLYGVFRVVLL